MTPLQLSALLLTVAKMAWGAAIAASTASPATTSPSLERASSPPAALAPAHPRRAPTVDNATSVALDILNLALLNLLNLALLNLAYTETVPYGEVLCRPTDPTHHQLARADAVFRKGIPNLAAGKRDSCDVAPAMGRCEHLWCGANSGIYLCPRTNENRIRFSCSEVALYAFAAVVECRGGKGVMGRTWDREGRFTVEVWGGKCVK